jgi:23S rRNA pseudouridine2605 synthase
MKSRYRPPRTEPTEGEHTKEPTEPIRLNRYIAQAGICARRKADAMISEGLVKVNGEVVVQLGTKVQPGDVVEVNGREISPQRFVHILLNKPKDTITTTADEKGRKTVMDLLDLPVEEKDGLFPVGRLDRNTLGALLITNDGELANRLLHPSFEVEKLYRIETKDSVQPHELEKIRAGITLEDGPAQVDAAMYLEPPNKHLVGLALHEGRNREVRRIFEALGHDVVTLERVRYAGLDTRGIRRGRWRRLEPKEIRKLRRLVKL